MPVDASGASSSPRFARFAAGSGALGSKGPVCATLPATFSRRRSTPASTQTCSSSGPDAKCTVACSAYRPLSARHHARTQEPPSLVSSTGAPWAGKPTLSARSAGTTVMAPTQLREPSRYSSTMCAARSSPQREMRMCSSRSHVTMLLGVDVLDGRKVRQVSMLTCPRRGCSDAPLCGALSVSASATAAASGTTGCDGSTTKLQTSPNLSATTTSSPLAQQVHCSVPARFARRCSSTSAPYSTRSVCQTRSTLSSEAIARYCPLGENAHSRGKCACVRRPASSDGDGSICAASETTCSPDTRSHTRMLAPVSAATWRDDTSTACTGSGVRTSVDIVVLGRKCHHVEVYHSASP